MNQSQHRILWLGCLALSGVSIVKCLDALNHLGDYQGRGQVWPWAIATIVFAIAALYIRSGHPQG